MNRSWRGDRGVGDEVRAAAHKVSRASGGGRKWMPWSCRLFTLAAAAVALSPLMSLAAPASALSQGASAVNPFFSAAIFKTGVDNRHDTLTALELLGIGQSERLTFGCAACGGARFHRTDQPSGVTVLSPSHPVASTPTTRVIVGAVDPGDIGRWKLYGLQHNTFGVLAQGCMPTSVTALTDSDAGRPSTIPSAHCAAGTLSPPGSEYVFWRGTDRRLWEIQYAHGLWDRSAPDNSGALGSAPTVAVHADGEQDVFWEGLDGRLWEMWYTGRWNGPINLPGAGALGSAPVAAVAPSGIEYVFWKGIDNSLWEINRSHGHWSNSFPLNSGALGSAPTVAVHADGEQDVFWEGLDGRLWEMWYTGRWNGPINLPGAGALGSSPAAGVG
jgi:hypothetical protein